MKKIQILIVGVLIAFALSDDFDDLDDYSLSGCVELTLSASKKTCNGYKFTETEKAAGLKYCCYIESGSNKACLALDQEGYKDIGKNKDNYKSGKIECISSYLELGLLAAIIVLIL